MPLSTGRALPAPETLLLAGWKHRISWLLGAVLEGDQPGPADERAAHLRSALCNSGS